MTPYEKLKQRIESGAALQPPTFTPKRPPITTDIGLAIAYAFVSRK